jgi:hypothetical protein
MLWQDTTNDEQALYCFDGTVWFEISGANGADGSDGNIQDGASDGSQDGIVATWDSSYDQWRANDAVTVDASGNAAFSGIAKASAFETQANNFASTTYTGASSATNGVYVGLNGSGDFDINCRDGGDFNFIQSGLNRLQINASGDATFSQSIHLQDGNARFFWNDTVNETRLFSNGGLTFRTGGFNDPNTALTIDASGHATFSGDIAAKRAVFSDSATTRIELNDTSNATGKKFLRSNVGRFDIVSHDYSTRIFIVDDDGNGTFPGTLKVEGTRPVSTKADLIKTLSTLRQATLDETQDIRESLRSAIDELVAGLEHEISTMPAPEPEVSTMEEAE